jgi:hypothetical protein
MGTRERYKENKETDHRSSLILIYIKEIERGWSVAKLRQ